MFYWDGGQWVTTLSHDGRTRWNGSAWMPTGQAAAPPVYQQPARPKREPTSWTRPIQYAVAGWYLILAIYSLSTPLWMAGPIAQAINQSMQRQQQMNPDATLPPGFTDLMSSIMTASIWVSAIVVVAVYVVIIVGALNRWTWMFYVVLILLGFSAISLPLNIINVFTAPSMSAAQGFSLPSWVYVLSVVLSIPATALFVWMLVALVKRGPWGMTRARLG
jgi:hypothetical protein